MNKIGEKEIRAARVSLEKYMAAKAKLDERIRENERWFRLRRLGGTGASAERGLRHSAWLFNSIINKHADYADAVPECTVLPREEADEREARLLTGIIPVVLERGSWGSEYSDAAFAKLKTGTAVYSVLWNSESDGGLGEIEVKNTDILKLFWEPGIRDIQKSRNLFYVDLADNELLFELYPFLVGRLGGTDGRSMRYAYDDSVDTSGKSMVVDWYYKKKQGGATRVHFCKFVNDILLYASENDPEYAERGWYDHGQYPFVFDPLFKEEGTPAGFGFIDIMKDAQEEIDILDNAILKNARMAAKRRYFTRVDGAVNEREFADFSKDFVHVNGSSLGEDSLREISFTPLPDIYVTVLNNKINELKETSGNRDFSQGGTAGGVTSGVAIGALQEAGNKLSRDMISSTYFAFSRVCLLIIELIRQFYTVPRCLRITGEDGKSRFYRYDSSFLRAKPASLSPAHEARLSCPLFDVKVKTHKQDVYSRTVQNRNVLDFYSLGFFDPLKARQSLACLELMDVENKEKLMNIIARNGEKYGKECE